MQTHTYPTDLSDAAWARLEPLYAVARTRRPLHHQLRTMVNALLCVLRTGCAWRLLPADWPPWQSVYYSPWQSVYYYLRTWRRDGTLARIHTVLRDQLLSPWDAIHSPVRAVWTVNRCRQPACEEHGA